MASSRSAGLPATGAGASGSRTMACAGAAVAASRTRAHSSMRDGRMQQCIGLRARALSGMLAAMATWKEFSDAAPELARAARELLDAHVHKTIATLRADGSPRISGIEAQVLMDDLWFGSMPGAVKARDLQRDPRFALHSGSE